MVLPLPDRGLSAHSVGVNDSGAIDLRVAHLNNGRGIEHQEFRKSRPKGRLEM